MIATNRIRLIDCLPTRKNVAVENLAATFRVFQKNFHAAIQALITSINYNSVKFFREEVADFEEFFASVNYGGCIVVNERLHKLRTR